MRLFIVLYQKIPGSAFFQFSIKSVSQHKDHGNPGEGKKGEDPYLSIRNECSWIRCIMHRFAMFLTTKQDELVLSKSII